MTIAERAAETVRLLGVLPAEQNWATSAIVGAIWAGVSDEREHCAKIAEAVQAEFGAELYHNVGGVIAARIREGT